MDADGQAHGFAAQEDHGVAAAADAVNHVYAVYANIGNDLSPVTRKKAKKILVATLIVGQISTFRFRQMSS